MIDNEKHKPPKGGANLECVFWCDKFEKEVVSDLIRICQLYQFMKSDKHYLLAYGSDPIEPLFIFSNNMEDYEPQIKNQNVQSCILKMTGILVGAKTPLSIIVDFKKYFLSVSIPEDVLWNFSDDIRQSDFSRLQEFSSLCEDISAVLSPILGYIGTEIFQSRDIQTHKVENSSAIPVNEYFFSESRLRDLYNWYMNSYLQRWQ